MFILKDILYGIKTRKNSAVLTVIEEIMIYILNL